MPIEDVKAGLSEAKIEFTDVKVMRTKNDNPNHVFFLVYFANKSITLQALNQTKFILHIVVKWSTYIQARNGPTQCNNCQLYGHGVKNCHLPPKCAKCGRSHPTGSCTKDQQNDDTFIHLNVASAACPTLQKVENAPNDYNISKCVWNSLNNIVNPIHPTPSKLRHLPTTQIPIEDPSPPQ